MSDVRKWCEYYTSEVLTRLEEADELDINDEHVMIDFKDEIARDIVFGSGHEVVLEHLELLSSNEDTLFQVCEELLQNSTVNITAKSLSDMVIWVLLLGKNNIVITDSIKVDF